MLLDDQTWAVANRADDLLAATPPGLESRLSPERSACVVELRTGVHNTVSGLVSELASLRASLDGAARALDLRVAAAGTHPTMRALAHREPTMALHVHVGVPDEAAAMRALSGLRADLPLLVALSANSPFWRGGDTGFASMRIPLLGMFPAAEPGFPWDARVRPALGTLEVRLMDAQTSVDDVGTMAALVQALARHHAEAPPVPAVASETLAENRFLAARDGMSAWFIDGLGPRRPAADALGRLLERLAPVARALGSADQLAGAALLAESPGYARQRAVAAAHGPAGVMVRLAAAFAGGGPALAAA